MSGAEVPVSARRQTMDPESIHQPHDKLFKAVFSNPETAAAFLRTHLPASLANTLQWSALELHPNNRSQDQKDLTRLDQTRIPGDTEDTWYS